MNEEQFINAVRELGIDVSNEQLEKLNLFYKLLIEWNERINLTSIIERDSVYLKHFYDSLTLIKACSLGNITTLCDVGTGAGFPGIVLKIFFPNIEITLIDSLSKRINYLSDVINVLGLKGIVAIHSRMEDYSRDNPEKFDVITARAVASISLLSEISVNSLKIGGKLILMKGNATDEIEGSSRAFEKLFIKLDDVIKFLLPIENSNRMLVSIVKLKKTDKIYPRNIDKIRKNPL